MSGHHTSKDSVIKLPLTEPTKFAVGLFGAKYSESRLATLFDSFLYVN